MPAGANVHGLEFEAKGKLQALIAQAPNLDVRLGLTRNWSQVAKIPGPGNRLAQQPRMTAAIGSDWRIEGTNWTTGANYSFEQGGYSRNSVTSSAASPYGRKLDLYGLWEPDKSRRVRLSIINALSPTEEKRALYADDSIVVVDANRTRSFVAVKAQVELTF